MKIEVDSIEYRGAVIYRIIPNKTISKLGSSSTPSIANCEYWYCSGATVTINDFLLPSNGQRLYILGDGLTTISNNTKIKTNTGANKLLAANKVYRFTYFDKWYEDE